ncbi:bacterio-opsin activator domain-containing protein [Halobacteriaceae archaeon GCM10025711]
MTGEPLPDSLRETLAVFDDENPGTPLTTAEVAVSLDIGRRSTYDRLDALVSRDRLETKKVGARGRVWWRPRSGTGDSPDEPDRRRDQQPKGLESEREEVFDRISDGFYGLDEQLRFTYVNDRAQTLLGMDESDVVGRDIRDTISLTDDFEAALREALAGQEPVFLEDYYEPLDSWFENAFYPSTTGVSVYVRDITGRKERERQLERQRERLTALDELNSVFRDVTDAVIEQQTRGEIEAIVCERLAASDSYSFAWIGDVDVQSQTVNLRMEAGVEGYLDGTTISVDPADEYGNDPTRQAILERDLQVTRDLQDESSDRHRNEQAQTRDVRSSAAVPVLYEDTFYGVLNVYTERPDAFTEDEQSVLGQLGEVVGHAIAAVERKRALISDEVVELEFQLPEFFGTFGVPVSVDGTITFDRTIPVGETAFLEYGTATGNAIEAVEAVVESEALPHWDSVTVLGSDGDATRFELSVSDPPVLSTIASLGGYIQQVRIEDGDYFMRVHLAPSADVRRVIDLVQDVYPAMELIAQRQMSRDQQPSALFRGALFEELTDRQRVAIETAYLAGFFEWPRESTAEEIAETLDIASPTLHQHLRKVQNKIFTTLLDDRLATE